MTTTDISTESAFIKPYYIEELGEEGLRVYDLAKALKTKVKHIHQKLTRGFLEGCDEVGDWRYSSVEEKLEIHEVTGLKYNRVVKSFALNTNAAKAFVATYQSKIGRAYLSFLFKCEYTATEILPKVLVELEMVKLENKELKEEKFKRKNKKHKVIVGGQQTVFGHIEPVYESKYINDMSETQKEQYKQKQRLRSFKGILNAMEKAHEKSQVFLEEAKKLLK